MLGDTPLRAVVDRLKTKYIMQAYAHTKQHDDGSQATPNTWEPLFTPFSTAINQCLNSSCLLCESLLVQHGHLNKVAWWTAKFARDMFSKEIDRNVAYQWGYILGLWHDLGKFSAEFQAYLLRATGMSDEIKSSGKVDHSTAGAQVAIEQFKVLGHFIAYGIAGHHSGLLDAETGASMRARLQKLLPTFKVGAPSEIIRDQSIPQLPQFLKKQLSPQVDAFGAQFFTRMLYSCLIDADFLATEAFINPKQAASRQSTPINALTQIDQLITSHILKFGKPDINDIVNQKRAQVVNDCIAKSEMLPGLFTLTVPTGGGKTLSSLLFALRHALKHGQTRIIYVAPFTSIIEQNADVIRKIIQPLETKEYTPLIEHHAALSPEKETNQSRLATENWDAPIIITTAVQFYESLFAAKTSRSRKLHNIANAVVILDEAQTLPVGLLAPCLRVVQELAQNYHTTIVLCTATQPAIGYHPATFPIGLTSCREIISDTKALFSALKRVEITNRGKLTDSDLAKHLQDCSQVLCIVNRREHARKIFKLLGSHDGNFHLSALMCPEHRSQILAAIRKRLNDKLPTRLVSTQLIEAGVDIDFPVVYRALAGLDSIAQAAGRCNRNGQLQSPGQVFTFNPEDTKGELYFRDTAQVTSQILELENDLLNEVAIQRYFDLYYYQNKSRWDEHQILDCFSIRPNCPEFPLVFNFATAASQFKLIDNQQVPVIIPFDTKAVKLISDLRNPKIPLHQKLLRGLQRYTVQIPQHLLVKNVTSFEQFRDDQFNVLISVKLNYSQQSGLVLDPEETNKACLCVSS